MCHERPNVREFGLIRAQKFFPGWNIEEKIADGDRGAGRTRNLVTAQQFAACDFDGRAGLLIGRARFEQQAAIRKR